MVPDEWNLMRLRELCSLITKGATPTTSGYSFVEKHLGVRFLGGNNCTERGCIVGEDFKFIQQEAHERQKRSQLAEGDLLFCIVGTLGETGRVLSRHLPANINQNVALIRPDESKVSTDYLHQFLMSPTIARMIWDEKTTQAQPSLSLAQIGGIKLGLPKKAEQTKIAEILSTWDKSIEATERLLENSKKRKKALMQQLLTGKKRLPGFENHQWVTAKANTVFKTVSIKRNSPNEPLLAVTQDQGAIPRDMLDRRVVMPDGETSGYKLVVPGNFIISLRSFQGGLEFSRYRGLVSPAYTILDFLDKNKHSPNFFRHYFKSYDFIGHLAVAVIGIRDGKQISYDDFSFLRIPAPSIEEQKKIASFLDAEDLLIDSISRRLFALQNEKKALMQQLLTGKKRVKVEEIV